MPLKVEVDGKRFAIIPEEGGEVPFPDSENPIIMIRYQGDVGDPVWAKIEEIGKKQDPYTVLFYQTGFFYGNEGLTETYLLRTTPESKYPWLDPMTKIELTPFYYTRWDLFCARVRELWHSRVKKQ